MGFEEGNVTLYQEKIKVFICLKGMRTGNVAKKEENSQEKYLGRGWVF